MKRFFKSWIMSSTHFWINVARLRRLYRRKTRKFKWQIRSWWRVRSIAWNWVTRMLNLRCRWMIWAVRLNFSKVSRRQVKMLALPIKKAAMARQTDQNCSILSVRHWYHASLHSKISYECNKKTRSSFESKMIPWWIGSEMPKWPKTPRKTKYSTRCAKYRPKRWNWKTRT